MDPAIYWLLRKTEICCSNYHLLLPFNISCLAVLVIFTISLSVSHAQIFLMESSSVTVLLMESNCYDLDGGWHNVNTTGVLLHHLVTFFIASTLLNVYHSALLTGVTVF